MLAGGAVSPPSVLGRQRGGRNPEQAFPELADALDKHAKE